MPELGRREIGWVLASKLGPKSLWRETRKLGSVYSDIYAYDGCGPVSSGILGYISRMPRNMPKVADFSCKWCPFQRNTAIQCSLTILGAPQTLVTVFKKSLISHHYIHKLHIIHCFPNVWWLNRLIPSFPDVYTWIDYWNRLHGSRKYSAIYKYIAFPLWGSTPWN